LLPACPLAITAAQIPQIGIVATDTVNDFFPTFIAQLYQKLVITPSFRALYVALDPFGFLAHGLRSIIYNLVGFHINTEILEYHIIVERLNNLSFKINIQDVFPPCLLIFGFPLIALTRV
jgi:hypothetical protein